MDEYIIKGKTITKLADSIREKFSITDMMSIEDIIRHTDFMVSTEALLFDDAPIVFNIPDSSNITEIPDYMFYEHSGPIQIKSLPNSITRIGQNAFSNCARA